MVIQSANEPSNDGQQVQSSDYSLEEEPLSGRQFLVNEDHPREAIEIDKRAT